VGETMAGLAKLGHQAYIGYWLLQLLIAAYNLLKIYSTKYKNVV